MNRFDFYPGDYLRDTIDLKPAEDGVYLRLIFWYYSNERPISDDRATMISRADSEITHGILRRFFEQREDENGPVWVHPRIEREITKLVNARNRAKENGKKGGRPPGKKPKANPEGTQEKPRSKAKQNPEEKPPSPSPSPSPNPSPSPKEKETACKQAFDIFYKAFPNKKSPQQAWDTWQKLWKKKTLPTISKLIESINYQNEMRIEYERVGAWVEHWKHPSTWLNAGAWEDQIDPPKSSKQSNHVEAIAAYDRVLAAGRDEGIVLTEREKLASKQAGGSWVLKTDNRARDNFIRAYEGQR